MQRALDRLAGYDLAPLLSHFACRYPLATAGPGILRTAIAREVSLHSLNASYAELWARARGFDRVVFVGSSAWDGVLLSEPASGRRVVGGVGRLLNHLGGAISVAAQSIGHSAHFGRIGTPQVPGPGKPDDTSGNAVDPPLVSHRTVLYVLNMGGAYGSLYAYDHVFSEDEHSVMHRRNVVVMSRTGGPDNAEGIRHGYPDGGSRITKLRTAVVLSYRALREFGARYEWRYIWLLATFCAAVDGQRVEIKQRYPSVRTAVLAYEVQVPMQLVLALESHGIPTIAFNERPLSVVQETQPFAVTTLLTASPYFSDAALHSRSVLVRNPVPVGLWRSDMLLRYRGALEHELVEEAHRKGRRLVVALPYHARRGSEWGGNPLATSSFAVGHFLRSMVELAEMRPDLEIVVRGKNDSWLDDPEFRAIVHRLDALDNISVSRDYQQLNESYRLCARADLIVAKYTSLVDEALSVGIPCVVHDFSPNASGITRGIARHLPRGVWAEGDEELIDRIDFALRDGGRAFRDWWEDYRLAIYGDVNDGSVRERARKILEDLAEPKRPDYGTK
jgi:glycosyltransferase involved in cell wall biosynthesis